MRRAVGIAVALLALPASGCLTASRPIRDPSDAFKDFAKYRNEIKGGIGYKRLSVGYYVSTEFDYFAQQVSGGYNHDLLDENLNISVGTSYGWDRIDPVQDEDTNTAPDSRTTWHANAIATGIITPTTLLASKVVRTRHPRSAASSMAISDRWSVSSLTTTTSAPSRAA